MAKRLLEKQKEEIISSFIDGKSIDLLSEKFNCTKLTIIRNLKKSLGENKYKEILNQFKVSGNSPVKEKQSKKNKNYNLETKRLSISQVNSSDKSELLLQEENFNSAGFRNKPQSIKQNPSYLKSTHNRRINKPSMQG